MTERPVEIMELGEVLLERTETLGLTQTFFGAIRLLSSYSEKDH